MHNYHFSLFLRTSYVDSVIGCAYFLEPVLPTFANPFYNVKVDNGFLDKQSKTYNYILCYYSLISFTLLVLYPTI